MTSVHPRLSVSESSSRHWTLDEDLAHYAEVGIGAVGIAFAKLEATGDVLGAADRVLDAGLHVTNLFTRNPFTLEDPDRWPDERDRAGLIMDTALRLHPDIVVLTTGSARSMPWERAADAFAEVMAGTILEAERESVHLALEHTNALRTDISFVHTLRDAIDLAWRVDMGVCLEVNACWAERNLAGTITAGVDAISLVQVSDSAIGTLDTPNRLVPGDGDIPLRRILGHLLDAGYDGMFDLEIIGPRIEEEGYAPAIDRGLLTMTELLEDLASPIESTTSE